MFIPSHYPIPNSSLSAFVLKIISSDHDPNYCCYDQEQHQRKDDIFSLGFLLVLVSLAELLASLSDSAIGLEYFLANDV